MPADDDRLRDRSPHPDVLPWYVSERLDPPEAERVRAHVETCAACGEEVRVLAAMRREMIGALRANHVPTADLVEYADGGSTLSADRRAEAERHLRDCAACQQDLEVLAAASRESIGGSPTAPAEALGSPLPRVRRTTWIWAAATAALVVVGSGLLLRGLIPRPLPIGGLQEIRSITLLPPERAGQDGPALTGAGPWVVTVVLPFGAPDGTYTVRIEAGEGRPPSEPRVATAAAREGRLSLLVGDLPVEAGYRLFVEQTEAPRVSYAYEFRIDR
jgi:anti-sigma factor RsiW